MTMRASIKVSAACLVLFAQPLAAVSTPAAPPRHEDTQVTGPEGGGCIAPCPGKGSLTFHCLIFH